MVFKGTLGEPTKLDELTVERDVDAGSLTGPLAGGGKIERLLGAGLKNDNQELTINPGSGLSLNNNDLDVTASFSGISGISNPLTADVDADGFDINNLRRLGVEELSDDKPITINQTQIGDQLIPSGEIVTGPQSTSLNAEASVLNEAPINSDATAGTESVITMLASGLDPTMTVSRTLDGQGGAYGHQLDAPLGRFARINANLSFEFDTLSDVPNWETGTSDSSFSFSVTDRPRRIRVEHDGTASSVNYNGLIATPIVDTQSLDSYRITFHDVSLLDDGGTQISYIGLGNETVDKRLKNHSKHIGFKLTRNRVTTSNKGDEFYSAPSFDTNHDMTIEVTPSETRFFVDGNLKAETDTLTANLRPIIQTSDNGDADGTPEILEVQQVTVEPIGGTF
jgi:hypothetical protein